MYELTIGGQVYQFKFGMGFMREINKKVSQAVDGAPKDYKKNVGLNYAIAGIIDGDVEELVDVLIAANKGMQLRVTKELLDNFIDDECEDIDIVFEEVLNFLGKANATKKAVANLQKMIEEEKAKAEKAEN